MKSSMPIQTKNPLAYNTPSNSHQTPVNKENPTDYEANQGASATTERGRQYSVPNIHSVKWRRVSTSPIKFNNSDSTSPDLNQEQRRQTFDNAEQNENRDFSLQEFLNSEDRRRASAPTVLSGKDVGEKFPTSVKHRRLSLSSITQRIRSLSKGPRDTTEEPIWTERYSLDFPTHISRDASELDFLRRRNQLAAAGIKPIYEDED